MANFQTQVPLQQTGQLQQSQPQSVEQQALSGNKQNISNFMNALQNVGAGSNNRAMNTPAPVQGTVPNLINPGIANNPYANFNTNINNPAIQQQTGGMNMGGVADPNQPLLPISSTFGLKNSQVMSNAGPTTSSGAPLSLQFTAQSHTNPAVGNYSPTMQQPTVQNNTNYTIPLSGTSMGTTNVMPYVNPTQTYAPQTVPNMTATSPITSKNVYTPYGGNIVVSDENLKTDIQSSDRSLTDFMSKVGAHSYQYTNPEIDGQGTFYGPMAQELEKTEAGKHTVINTPRGKMVNTGRLTLVNTAALSVMHQEQQKLQKQVEALQNKLNKRK